MIFEPTDPNLRKAGEAIREGRLVATPTETVYGLAADALNVEAIARVFQAKGRPADNPLIVHLAHLEQLPLVVAEVTEDARRLLERFWPGPLTLVLPKAPGIPDVVTGGRPTVAVRIPAHPVALRLIDAANRPLAAPSANLFMSLSPSRADHVTLKSPDLWGVLDGGPCAIGIESTVVDVSGETPRLLRPGAIPRPIIEAVLRRDLAGATDERRAPGQYPRHYAPRVPLSLADFLVPNDIGITLDEPTGPRQVRLSRNPTAYAIALYATLHRLEEENPPEIVVQRPPATPEWEAVRDRLTRAAKA